MFHTSSKTGQARTPAGGLAITSGVVWRFLCFQGFATLREMIIDWGSGAPENDHGLTYSQITLTLTRDPQANPLRARTSSPAQ
jgi:hypothetical protein